jgi:hypothetical protein
MSATHLSQAKSKKLIAEYRALETDEERDRWMAEQKVGAVEMTDLNTLETHWQAMLGPFRLADEDKKSIRFETVEEAEEYAMAFRKQLRLDVKIAEAKKNPLKASNKESISKA